MPNPLAFPLLLLLLTLPLSLLDTVRVVHVDSHGRFNVSANEHRVMVEDKCRPAKACQPGLILPVWEPPASEIGWAAVLFRAVVYLLAMAWLFLGVSIVADRFMAAIEVITSQERELVVKRPDGKESIVLVRIWNETVSNLTLMALGSSAPEILLSVIEIFGNNFLAGDLGPGTIVGSAAFNLFCIVAICIVVIPNGETRRIERNDVFWVTVAWSTFAYVWLYLILCFFSPNIVEVWEGLATFFFFFCTVLCAYAANRYAPSLGRRFLKRGATGLGRSRASPPNRGILAKPPQATAQGDSIRLDFEAHNDKALLEVEDQRDGDGSRKPSAYSQGASEAGGEASDVAAFNEHRQKFVQYFQKLRVEHPEMSLKQVGKVVALKSLEDTPKSRAFRRIQASRQLTACHPFSRSLDSELDHAVEPLVSARHAKPKEVTVSFRPCHYICAEDVGTLKLYVKCDRGSIDTPTVVTVSYATIDGTAKAGEDYLASQGMLIFTPEEDYKELPITIVNDDSYEFDEEFFVRLSSPDAVSAACPSEHLPAVLGTASEALIIVVDDDHGGIFGFESQVERVNENQEFFYLTVNRQRGARGKVTLPYKIIEGRAKRGVDFNCDDGQLVFQDHQNTAQIRIALVNDQSYEKSEDFFVQLEQPLWGEESRLSSGNGSNSADGRPYLAENSRCKVIILEDDELRSFVDRLIAKANSSLMVGTTSWRQQFREALDPWAAEEDTTVVDGEPAAPAPAPTVTQRVLHCVSLPWKLLFACIPPTDYFQGWLCFAVAILFIGLLTAVIGDVAAMFGCTIGLKDTVTAITLVALGTSIPDTFASKMAATQDKTADSSIGNVTGSNAVNVFLGIGVAWAIAAIYHAAHGTVFHVHAGSLASSVALFLLGSIVCVAILQWRRHSASVGAELGGPTPSKWASAGVFVALWVAYILYCALDAYCII